MEHKGPRNGGCGPDEQESGRQARRSHFQRHLRLDPDRYPLHPEIIALQQKARDGAARATVETKPIVGVGEADLRAEEQSRPKDEPGIAPDEKEPEAGKSFPVMVFDTHDHDFAARSDLMLEDYSAMEEVIRTLDEKVASEGLRVLEKMMTDALVLARTFPERQQLAELHRLMNALDYLVGRACGSTQPKEWFKFIENNPKIFEFALVAKRFDINEMGNARVLDLSKRLDQKLLDRIEGKTDGLATTQEKFVAVADLLAESNRLTDEDAGLLKTQLSSGDDEKKGIARARINELLLMRGIMIENGLSDARNPDTFDIVKVDAVMFTRESRVLLVESMPGRAPIYEGLGGLYNRCSNAIIVVKKETTLSEKEQNEMKKTMMSLGVPDSGGKNGNGELPPDAVMWHEVRHYLDALSGYLQRCKELAQDGKTIRAILWTPERLPAGVLTEATAFADGYIRSGMSDEQIRADMEGSRGGMGIHSWARSMGIGWWMNHAGENVRAARLPAQMRRFIDEEYVRVIGISSSELYGSVGKTPAEILREKGGRTGGARAEGERTEDIARTRLVGPEIFEAAMKRNGATAGPKISADEQKMLDGKLFSAITIRGSDAGIEVEIRAIIESGADVNARDDSGNTPLIIASANGSTRAVSALLENDAGVDERDGFGSTALMYSLNTDVANALFEKGADPAARNNFGWNAVTYALEHVHSHAGVVELLGLIESRGGKQLARQIVSEGVHGQMSTQIGAREAVERETGPRGLRGHMMRIALKTFEEDTGTEKMPQEYWHAVSDGICQAFDGMEYGLHIATMMKGLMAMQFNEMRVSDHFRSAYMAQHYPPGIIDYDRLWGGCEAKIFAATVLGGIKTAADATGCDLFVPHSQPVRNWLRVRLVRRIDMKSAKIDIGHLQMMNNHADSTEYDEDSDFESILGFLAKEREFV